MTTTEYVSDRLLREMATHIWEARINDATSAARLDEIELQYVADPVLLSGDRDRLDTVAARRRAELAEIEGRNSTKPF